MLPRDKMEAPFALMYMQFSSELSLIKQEVVVTKLFMAFLSNGIIK